MKRKTKNKVKMILFNIAIISVIATHIYSIFFDMTEAMWLGHNIFMIISGITIWMAKK